MNKLFLLLTCTIVVVVANNQTDFLFENWGTTLYKVSNFTYTWNIKNFSFCDQDFGEELRSPYFADGINNEYIWNLVLYPKGQTIRNEVAIFLNVNKLLKRVAYKFTIIDKNNQPIVIAHDVDPFTNGRMKGILKFTTLDFILNEENGVLLDHQLTILVEIKATMGSENFAGKLKKSTPQSHLIQDLDFLFKNQSFSDVTLSVRGKEFQSHKAILAIRSSTFKSMFEKDPNIARVEIDDLDSVVVNEMLHYIYTDEISNLQYLTFDLLKAAVIYELDGLKTICANIMSANLSIENSADFFILGDTYNADVLKTDARDFIFTHIADVVHTRGFKSMTRTHPHLLKEVFMN